MVGTEPAFAQKLAGVLEYRAGVLHGATMQQRNFGWHSCTAARYHLDYEVVNGEQKSSRL